MASAVSICSNALLELGDESISSLSENTKRAQRCANIWPQVRDSLLRMGVWPCARKQVILPASATTPDFDWDYKFDLPGDWLRTLQVGARNERLDYELIGRSIYADVASLKLLYVWKNTDPALWDPVLIDLATTVMCARLAYATTQSASLAELKAKIANDAMREARSIAGRDNQGDDLGDSPFIDARF